jgi:hypothetical protein
MNNYLYKKIVILDKNYNYMVLKNVEINMDNKYGLKV